MPHSFVREDVIGELLESLGDLNEIGSTTYAQVLLLTMAGR